MSFSTLLPPLALSLPVIASLAYKSHQSSRRPAALVIVDPLSTGAVWAHEACTRGIPVIRVMSGNFDEVLKSHAPGGFEVKYEATFEHDGSEDVSPVVKQIQNSGWRIRGVVAGCETGVEVADAVAAALGKWNNDPKYSSYRRNKYDMQEQIRRCGIRAAAQVQASKWEDIPPFLATFNPDPFQVVIKPVQSAGTDNVYLCKSPADLKAKFDHIMSSSNILGLSNTSVVVQEYLVGTEYVVDTVSFHGQHKVIALWEYDKRQVNNSNFVYFTKRLMSGDEPAAQKIIPYMKEVLTALKIQHGVGHGEVILTKNGPCLVEVGARPHGGEGSWTPVTRACIGYDVLTVATDLYEDPSRFQSVPDIPLLKRKFGCEAYFVSYVGGPNYRLVGYKNVDKLKALPSYLSHMWFLKPGSVFKKTIDVMTIPGSCLILNDNEEQLRKDMKGIHDVCAEGMFIVEPIEANGKGA